MASKRKNRKVPKASSVPPERPIEQPKPTPQATPKPDPEALIIQNGNLVENLLNSREWKEIVLPLILEGVASISGKYVNHKFYLGSFTKKTSMSLEAQSGYQLALEELNNRIYAFVEARNNLIARKKAEEEEKKAPLINPMTEDTELED